MKKEEVPISVIMGVYNQMNEEVLSQAVDSILNQSFRDFEFIIYDDGSRPEAVRLLKKIAGKDSRILLIGQQVNHGLAYSLNACVKQASGRYIARMDADDISAPDRLKEEYDFLESHPEYSWCGCNAGLIDENGIWGERQMPETPTEKDYLKYSPYIHPTVMFRDSVFKETTGYAVSKETMLCEDYEFFMRLQRIGKKGYNIQKNLFSYREDKSSYQRRNLQRRINEARVRYDNFRKMGILFPTGWVYVLRPIFASMIPGKMLKGIKRREAWKKD